MPFCKTSSFIKTSYEHSGGGQRQQAEAVGLSLLAGAAPLLAQCQHTPVPGSLVRQGRGLPISDPAEIAAGVRELSVWGQEAKVSPAAGLTVTAMELGRPIKAGHELGRILAAYRQVSGGLGW